MLPIVTTLSINVILHKHLVDTTILIMSSLITLINVTLHICFLFTIKSCNLKVKSVISNVTSIKYYKYRQYK